MNLDVRMSRRRWGRVRSPRTPDQRPVPRWAALAVLLAAVAAVALLSGAVGLLRHPAPGPPVPTQPEADPREAFTCPSSPAALDGTGDGIPEVDSNLLYECPAVFDGVRVTYTGEAVGAVMRRRAGVWLQLNDDAYAGDLGPLPAHQDFRGGNAGIGVLAPGALADAISFVGGPRERGDVVEVTGTFHRVDPVTREVAVLRADHARVVSPGAPLERVRLLDRELAAYAAAAVALALTAVERAVARRRRAGR